MEEISVEPAGGKPFSFSWAQKVDLEGKIVLIFGGGGNLGETFAYAAAASIMERVKRRLGRIDIVVNFAGVSHKPFDLFKDDPGQMVETFRRVSDTNLTGAFITDGRYKPRAMSILAHTPSKRFASREGVAESIIALCLDQRHLTGNVAFVDDGHVVEGHSWPEGNRALYAGSAELEALFRRLDEEHPPERT